MLSLPARSYSFFQYTSIYHERPTPVLGDIKINTDLPLNTACSQGMKRFPYLTGHYFQVPFAGFSTLSFLMVGGSAFNL